MIKNKKRKKNDYEESLENLYQVDKLNAEGLRDYIKILKEKLVKTECKIIDLEHEVKKHNQSKQEIK